MVETLILRIPKEKKEEFRKSSKRSGIPMSEITRRLIDEYLKREKNKRKRAKQ